MRRALLALPALLIAIALAGCVDLKADMSIAANGSGRLTMDYSVDKSIVFLESNSTRSNILFFPIDKAVLDRRALSLPGITLSRWSREDLKDSIRISIELRFPDIPSLIMFLDPPGKRITYSTADGRHELAVRLSDGDSLTPDAVAWSGASYGDRFVALAVTLPSRAVSASPGTLSASGTLAKFESATASILTSKDPLIWTVRW